MNIGTTQHLINYKTAAKRIQENKLMTNRFQEEFAELRAQQKVIINRVEGNTLETNRLNIAA